MMQKNSLNDLISMGLGLLTSVAVGGASNDAVAQMIRALHQMDGHESLTCDFLFNRIPLVDRFYEDLLGHFHTYNDEGPNHAERYKNYTEDYCCLKWQLKYFIKSNMLTVITFVASLHIPLEKVGYS
uniref:Uncharacterized protein n=1 Tax=Romanomermis culicivorax TaxID=13658 RepID=A0A915J517_ROMCU